MLDCLWAIGSVIWVFDCDVVCCLCFVFDCGLMCVCRFVLIVVVCVCALWFWVLVWCFDCGFVLIMLLSSGSYLLCFSCLFDNLD